MVFMGFILIILSIFKFTLADNPLGSGSHRPSSVQLDEFGPENIEPGKQLNDMFVPANAGSLYPVILNNSFLSMRILPHLAKNEIESE